MAKNSENKITQDILKRLKSYSPQVSSGFQGTVTSVGDGVARVTGLANLAYSEMVEFPHGVEGVAINLEEDEIGVIILGDYLKINEGDKVKGTGRLLSVGVSDKLVGRVINPLGKPLDGKPAVSSQKLYPIEKIAPGVTQRQPVNTPLQTGLKAIDSMIPIGRGQRELIIGDRGTGKTAVGIDTIINQKDENVICIYVAIGQKTSRIAQIVDVLARNGALDHTIIVSAAASEPASLQYIAPYTGTAIGEYFMDKGQDALVIFDDLSKHAWAYRQISLILRRPSGREAYPGDIFYLHSRLLERASKLNSKLGGGSITALPIIETQASDISSYIPTNVISITDGQIYLESDLFYQGVRPAVNAGLSVSRVGGAAQLKAVKQVAGRLRLEIAQYNELSAFAQFGSDLDAASKAKIDRGKRIIEILKQVQYKPVEVDKQVLVFWLATKGYLDEIETVKIADFELAYLDYINGQHKDILKKIRTEEKISDETAGKLNKLLDSFKKIFNG